MGELSQKGRWARLKTALGDDALLLASLDGEESLSRMFSFRLKAVAPMDAELDIDRVLGLHASVSFFDDRSHLDQPSRTIHGIIRSIDEYDSDGRFYWYDLELVPPCWPLSQNRRYRIFESATVADILREVLGQFAVISHFPTSSRNYCVQYDESDLDFATRLIEEEGGYFFFPPDDELGRMHVEEDSAGRPLPGTELRLKYRPTAHDTPSDPCVFAWRVHRELGPSSVTLRDRSFQTPGANFYERRRVGATIQAGEKKLAVQPNAMSKIDVYEYPGRHVKCHDAIERNAGADEDMPGFFRAVSDRQDRYASHHAERKLANSVCIDGRCNSPRVGAGGALFLESETSRRGAYLTMQATHSLQMNAFGESSDSLDSARYENSFTVLPRSIGYRTPLRTPRPVVVGHQPATVVAADGSLASSSDDIHTDKYGRIQVRFPWSEDNRNSCWVRVAQSSAGSRRGDIRIPRVGDEVVIGFEHGDPDCPLIYGSVYNGLNLPPHPLPDNRYRTGFTSCTNGSRLGGSPLASIPGSGMGGADDSTVTSVTDASSDTSDYSSYSGIAIGDDDGSEYLHIRAAGDMLFDTYSNQYFVVKNEQATFIETSQLTMIGGCRGIWLDLFGYEIKDYWGDELKIRFGDDLWNPVPIKLYYMGVTEFSANFGSSIKLAMGASRQFYGCTHFNSSSTWSMMEAIAALSPASATVVLEGLTVYASALGLTMGRVDVCNGNRHLETSRNSFDRSVLGTYAVAGYQTSVFKYLGIVYSLLNLAMEAIAGLCDIREGTTAREIVNIISDVAEYYGNIITNIERYYAGIKKVEAMTTAATSLAEIATSFAASGVTTAIDSALHVVQLAVDGVASAAELLCEIEGDTTLEVASAVYDSLADHYAYTARHFIADAQGSIYLMSKYRLHADVDDLFSVDATDVAVRASSEIVLGLEEGPYISIGATGITICYDVESWIEVTATGISINGLAIDMTALTTLLKTAPLIEHE